MIEGNHISNYLFAPGSEEKTLDVTFYFMAFNFAPGNFKTVLMIVEDEFLSPIYQILYKDLIQSENIKATKYEAPAAQWLGLGSSCKTMLVRIPVRLKIFKLTYHEK